MDWWAIFFTLTTTCNILLASVWIKLEYVFKKLEFDIRNFKFMCKYMWFYFIVKFI